MGSPPAHRISRRAVMAANNATHNHGHSRMAARPINIMPLRAAPLRCCNPQ
jgi:hypothetical protein